MLECLGGGVVSVVDALFELCSVFACGGCFFECLFALFGGEVGGDGVLGCCHGDVLSFCEGVGWFVVLC